MLLSPSCANAAREQRPIQTNAVSSSRFVNFEPRSRMSPFNVGQAKRRAMLPPIIKPSLARCAHWRKANVKEAACVAVRLLPAVVSLSA